MKTRFNISAIFCGLLFFSSCQDVIELDLENEVRSFSAVGSVTDGYGTRVELRQTAGYFDQGETPPIRGATIIIFENNQAINTLNESLTEPGIYESGFNGQVGNQYHVEIFMPQDIDLATQWRSAPVEMSRTAEIDSLGIRYLDRNTVPQAFTPGNYALLYFTEPEGTGDFYRLRRWLNDTLFSNEINIFDDENFDGVSFGGQFPGFTIYGPVEDEGDRVRAEIRSLSAGHFEFLSLISEQVYQVGGPFDPPPSPIIGNIYNFENPDEYAYGYFDASAVQQKTVVYQP